MSKYRVKLKFIYSDVVHVEADNEEEAEGEAMKHCQEEYECYYDCEIEEE